MFAIIAFAVIAFVALLVAVAVLGAIAHLLFWPLVLVAIAMVLWFKFGPRRSHRRPAPDVTGSAAAAVRSPSRPADR